MLFDYLNRVDLWERNIDEPHFETEYFKLKNLSITVGEAFNFYDILGGDSQLLNLNNEEDKKINEKKDTLIKEEEKEDDNDINNRNKIIFNKNEDNKEEINTSSKNKEEIDNDDKNGKIKNELGQKKKRRRNLF